MSDSWLAMGACVLGTSALLLLVSPSWWWVLGARYDGGNCCRESSSVWLRRFWRSRRHVCVPRTNPASDCQRERSVWSRTVVNYGSKWTWNCGLTKPVCGFRISATFLWWTGDVPKYMLSSDCCFHLWWMQVPERRWGANTYAGQPKGCQCFGLSSTSVDVNSCVGVFPSARTSRGVLL